MGAAALPGCAVQHRGDRRLEALVGVAGDQPDAGQAAGDQATQEPGPDRAVLGAAQLQPEQLPVAVGVTGGGHQHRGGVAHPPTFADLHRQRVDPHKHIRAGVQRPVAPRVDHLVELRADPRHLALGDPLQPHRAGHVIHPPGRHPLHIALHHHRGQRPLGPPARLQDRREVAALAQPRDLKLHRADPGCPSPWAGSRCGGSPAAGCAGCAQRRSGPRPRPPSAPGRACARPRAGSRHRRCRPCYNPTAPSWTRPPCSSSRWILRAFTSRMTRWSSHHHLPRPTQRGGARMLAQLLASSAVARVLHHFQGPESVRRRWDSGWTLCPMDPCHSRDVKCEGLWVRSHLRWR